MGNVASETNDKPTCETCPYWYQFGEGANSGSCRKGLPLAIGQIVTAIAPHETEEAVWPASRSDQWCGQHPDMGAWLAAQRAAQAPAVVSPEFIAAADVEAASVVSAGRAVTFSPEPDAIADLIDRAKTVVVAHDASDGNMDSHFHDDLIDRLGEAIDRAEEWRAPRKTLVPPRDGDQFVTVNVSRMADVMKAAREAVKIWHEWGRSDDSGLPPDDDFCLAMTALRLAMENKTAEESGDSVAVRRADLAELRAAAEGVLYLVHRGNWSSTRDRLWRALDRLNNGEASPNDPV